MKLKLKLMVWLLTLFSTIPIYGQGSSGDGYNPENPPEPTTPEELVKYKIVANANIDEAGMVTGSGRFVKGTRVTLRATANSGYKFLYWTMNNSASAYKTDASFVYQQTSADVTFTAVFEKLKHVDVRMADSKAGQAYGSGYYSLGARATISTTANENYTFSHWTKGNSGDTYSTEQTFSYEVGEEDAVFTAVYTYTPPPYTPENPEEPGDMTHKQKYNVIVSTNPENAGMVSGGGRYLCNRNVTISTSPNEGYRFLYWIKDGSNEPYKTTSSFTYTTSTQDVNFTAVYEEIPPIPVPESHKLYVKPEIAGSCTFNIANGTSIQEGEPYSVTVTPGTEHEFIGWYHNGVCVATTLTYGSYMGTEDVTLIAKCRYVPENPDEPNNPGGFIPEVDDPSIKGDVNGDGKITMADATATMDYYIHWNVNSDYDKRFDVNNDGKITMADAVAILNIYLTSY